MMTAEYPTVVIHRMLRGTWGYDAECACGWKTRTGGATKAYVDQLVWAHKNGWDS